MSKKVRVIQMCPPRLLYSHTVANDHAAVQTCGIIPLAWASIDADQLTVCVQTSPYCIVKDSSDTLWLHDRPSSVIIQGEVIWRRADAVEASNE